MGWVKECLRDFTFIVPRSEYNTIEFRTSCAQHNTTDILELICLRIAIMSVVCRDKTKKYSNVSGKLFYEVCETGKIDQQILNMHYNELRNVDIAEEFHVPLNDVLVKIENLSGSIV